MFFPPHFENEVWGKVIFLHLSVILFTGGACVVGGICGRGVCMAGGTCGEGACMAGCVCVVGGMNGRGCMVGGMHGRGACVAGGMCGRGVCAMGVCVAGGVHGRYYKIRSMSRWYASYWNAILFS